VAGAEEGDRAAVASVMPRRLLLVLLVLPHSVE
jgi:hypothetical protein